MTLVRYYGYRDKILIPTVMQAEEGFYFDATPVDVLAASDLEAVRAALSAALNATLEHGNKVVATPERSDEHDPGSPLLDTLRLRKWQQFEAEAAMYSIYINDETVEYYASGNAMEGSWITQRMRRQSFTPDCIDNGVLLDRMIVDVLADEQDRRPKSGSITLLLPPPAST